MRKRSFGKEAPVRPDSDAFDVVCEQPKNGDFVEGTGRLVDDPSGVATHGPTSAPKVFDGIEMVPEEEFRRRSQDT